MILAAASPYRAQSKASSNDGLAEKIDKILSSAYKPDIPGAAVIVVKNGQPIFRKGYGIANLELNIPIKPEMVFRIASLTKQFTAAAIMMLAEQGKLAVSDDITKFIPTYPTKGKMITIENLLTHTSGIKDYIEALWPQRMREDLTLEQLIGVFKDAPSLFEPGAKLAYSNSNYILLGAIIEKVSGRRYGEFIEENLFKPLGMKHSYCESNQLIVPNRVSGYAQTKDGYVSAPFISMTQLRAAGALMSSVDDLAIWDEALYSEKLLKRTSIERIFTPYKLASGELDNYGYGWEIEKFEGRTLASHTGGINGFTAYILRIPQDHIYIAILSNDRTAEVQPEYLAKKMAAVVLGRAEPEPEIIKVAPQVLEQYVGRYEFVVDYTLTITRQGERLFAQGTGEPRFELFPTSETAFIAKAMEAQFTFIKNEQGKVVALVARHSGTEDRAKKVQ
jgi:D-alanyl-D-alanine carboxypeptidase